MHHTLATRFARHNARQISAREALTDDQLRQVVPSIFAAEAHDSRSDKYVYVPTIDIVQGLRREGWQPFFAVQAMPRDRTRTGHAKHMLRLRRPEHITESEAAEVIIVNSHDGTTSYQMFAGLVRFVCTNSMIAGQQFEEVRVPHKGHIQDQIIEGAYTIAQDFPRLIDSTREMAALQLSKPEQRVFAEAALVARYGEEAAPVTPDQVLRRRRTADVGGDLWTTFNAVQENIVRGGLHGQRRTDDGRVIRRSTRPINGIDQNVGVNRALWTLAEGMRALKA
ncbi:DUF932 domain-containing protein [Novosphingobium sp. FKTRR1]|uniref:DUF932 domain-containing protein n=1 Tax=Novosphingobium sp. FKTRR1 TaxID=2879118 RepID=UPI001CF07347|nr:DUF932 domain-containing protein [Novosphingobium sp. FKTRR1]